MRTVDLLSLQPYVCMITQLLFLRTTVHYVISWWIVLFVQYFMLLYRAYWYAYIWSFKFPSLPQSMYLQANNIKLTEWTLYVKERAIYFPLVVQITTQHLSTWNYSYRWCNSLLLFNFIALHHQLYFSINWKSLLLLKAESKANQVERLRMKNHDQKSFYPSRCIGRRGCCRAVGRECVCVYHEAAGGQQDKLSKQADGR